VQYELIVMRRLSEIKNKRILLIVAHPDDETLWFFQSIQQLKTANEILIFCLTHAAVSKRGKELTKVVDDLGLKVVFGHCEDTGIDRLLRQSDLRQAFIKVFSKYKIDLAITHPPHGGEKPHPHHLQLYWMTKEFCGFHSIQFGFFSEQKLLEKSTKKRSYYLSIRKKRYVLYLLLKGYFLLSEDENKTTLFVKAMLSILFNFKTYSGFEVAVNLEEKQSVLANFESQHEVLKSYNAFYEKSEFLFLALD
tara:strand:+ start:52039 stop:52788 length:750 start_codon:yes stop_codon:yes gene_type:complete